MKKIRVGEAAKILGISIQTLRNWEKSGKLQAERSLGGQRFYDLDNIKKLALDLPKLGLAWVKSSTPPDIPPEYFCERSDRFTSRVARMGTELIKSESVTNEQSSLLTLIVGEIGDNSFAHNVGSWPDIPGVFYAYDLTKRLIVLADRGRGVKTTLQQIYHEPIDDTDSLRIAFTEVVSGRSPEKRGNGLKVVRKIIESSSIGLLFRSGIGRLVISKLTGRMHIEIADENIQGTYAVITF
jgi:hypothetical protein